MAVTILKEYFLFHQSDTLLMVDHASKEVFRISTDSVGAAMKGMIGLSPRKEVCSVYSVLLYFHTSCSVYTSVHNHLVITKMNFN